MLNHNSLKTALLTVACASVLGFSGAAQAKTNLMLGYADPEDSIFGKAAVAFSNKLSEVSGGELSVSMFPNGTLGGISEMPAMLQQGACDVTLIVTSSLMDFCPELGVFDLPFLFSGYDDAQQVLNGEAGKFLAGKLEEQSLHVAGWITMGFRETTSNKPVRSVADFKGLKIRTQSNEVHQAIFSALGAAPTVISFSELYTAMEQGTVDAEENPYVNIYSNTYYEVQKYLIETNHVFQAAAIVISKDTMDDFTDQQRAWVEEAAKYATDLEWQVTREDNIKAKEGAIKAGMELIELPHEDLLKATQSVYQKYDQQFGPILKLMNK